MLELFFSPSYGCRYTYIGSTIFSESAKEIELNLLIMPIGTRKPVFCKFSVIPHLHLEPICCMKQQKKGS